MMISHIEPGFLVRLAKDADRGHLGARPNLLPAIKLALWITSSAQVCRCLWSGQHGEDYKLLFFAATKMTGYLAPSLLMISPKLKAIFASFLSCNPWKN